MLRLGRPIAERVVGVVLLAIGAGSLVETFRIKDDWSAARLMPLVAAVALLRLGVAHLGARSPVPSTTEAGEPPATRRVVLVLAVLVAYVALLQQLKKGAEGIASQHDQRARPPGVRSASGSPALRTMGMCGPSIYTRRGGDERMSTTIRVRVRNGRLEPLEAVTLPEGAEVDIIVVTHDRNSDFAAFRSSFGGWKGTFDPDEFLAGLRQPLSRPEPKL